MVRLGLKLALQSTEKLQEMYLGGVLRLIVMGMLLLLPGLGTMVMVLMLVM